VSYTSPEGLPIKTYIAYSKAWSAFAEKLLQKTGLVLQSYGPQCYVTSKNGARAYVPIELLRDLTYYE
jgi:hypothetical protein